MTESRTRSTAPAAGVKYASISPDAFALCCRRIAWLCVCRALGAQAVPCQGVVQRLINRSALIHSDCVVGGRPRRHSCPKHSRHGGACCLLSAATDRCTRVLVRCALGRRQAYQAKTVLYKLSAYRWFAPCLCAYRCCSRIQFADSRMDAVAVARRAVRSGSWPAAPNNRSRYGMTECTRLRQRRVKVDRLCRMPGIL